MYTKTKAVRESRRARAEAVQKESDYSKLSPEQKMGQDHNRFSFINGEVVHLSHNGKPMKAKPSLQKTA